jgi:hypothetical protein
MKGKINAARARELLNYNPETGIFVWEKRTSNRISIGNRAGRENGNGYRRIAIDGFSYYEHQLAWLYIYGEWPEYEIDHRDGNGLNNSLSNLRQATHAENSQNQALRSTNSSGATGVSWSKLRSKWESSIWVGCEKKFLGLFDNFCDADAAYLKAKKELHKFQPIPRGA